jgi:hypothetical protein
MSKISRKKVNVEFIKDTPNHKKGSKAVMFEPTAKALAKHEIVKVGSAVSEK